MTPEEQALAAAWIREMWATCPEVSREQRAADRARAASLPTSVANDKIDSGHVTKRKGQPDATRLAQAPPETCEEPVAPSPISPRNPDSCQVAL